MREQKQTTYIGEKQLERDFDNNFGCLGQFLGFVAIIITFVSLLGSELSFQLRGVLIYIAACIPYYTMLICYVSYHKWKIKKAQETNNSISSKDEASQKTQNNISIKDVEEEVNKNYSPYRRGRTDKEIGAEYCKYALDYVYNSKFKQALEYTTIALKYDPNNTTYLQFKEILELKDTKQIQKRLSKSQENKTVTQKTKEESQVNNLNTEENPPKQNLSKEQKQTEKELETNTPISIKDFSKENQEQIDNIYLKALEKYNKCKYKECINMLNKAQINKSEKRFKELLSACNKELDEIDYNKAWTLFYEQRYAEAIQILKEKSQTNAKFKDLLDKATQCTIELSYNKALRYAYEKRYSKLKALVDEVKKFDLSPEQKKLFDIQDIIDKSEEKIIEDIYNEALNFFNSKDYIGTIYTLEEISKTSDKSKELLKQATQALVEVFYSEILEYKNKKNYYKVAELLAKSKQFNFNKEQEKIFDTFTRDVNNILETESRELYNKAIEYLNKYDYDNALKFANIACRIENSSINTKLVKRITNESNEYSTYSNALKQYNNKKLTAAKKIIDSNINQIKCIRIKKLFDNLAQEIDLIIENEFKQLRNTAIEYFVNNDYKNALKFAKEAKTIRDDDSIKEILTKLGEMYYKEAKNNFQASNYDIAQKNIKEALKAITNQKYLYLSEEIQKIYLDKTIAIMEKREEGTLEDARICIKKAIELNNKQNYNDLLMSIESFINNDNFDFSSSNITVLISEMGVLMKVSIPEPKDEEEFIKTTEIKEFFLESCTKSDLLAIDGFDEEKANRFISERENGKKYYDLETFAMDFELQPHQMIMLEDKLIFSQKPANKIGRKVDF